MADLESVATKTFIGFGFIYQLICSFFIFFLFAAGDMTLMNTKFEISLPGFMNIDFVNQIRKEEKIGGGGAAIIYKGVIVDPKLREVSFFFLSFFLFLFFFPLFLCFLI